MIYNYIITFDLFSVNLYLTILNKFVSIVEIEPTFVDSQSTMLPLSHILIQTSGPRGIRTLDT